MNLLHVDVGSGVDEDLRHATAIVEEESGSEGGVGLGPVDSVLRRDIF